MMWHLVVTTRTLVACTVKCVASCSDKQDTPNMCNGLKDVASCSENQDTANMYIGVQVIASCGDNQDIGNLYSEVFGFLQ